MERISEKFKSLQENGDTALIPFSVAGFPNVEKSLDIFLKLAEGDVLKFGFPFSDPVADGPVIQKAATEAIRNGYHGQGSGYDRRDQGTKPGPDHLLQLLQPNP